MYFFLFFFLVALLIYQLGRLLLPITFDRSINRCRRIVLNTFNVVAGESAKEASPLWCAHKPAIVAFFQYIYRITFLQLQFVGILWSIFVNGSISTFKIFFRFRQKKKTTKQMRKEKNKIKSNKNETLEVYIEIDGKSLF